MQIGFLSKRFMGLKDYSLAGALLDDAPQFIQIHKAVETEL